MPSPVSSPGPIDQSPQDPQSSDDRDASTAMLADLRKTGRDFGWRSGWLGGCLSRRTPYLVYYTGVLYSRTPLYNYRRLITGRLTGLHGTNLIA